MKAGTTYGAIVGSIIRSHREKNRINQGAMAESMGVTQATWSKIENGKSNIGLTQIVRAASILGTTPGQLLSDADVVRARIVDEGLTVSADPQRVNQSIALLGAAAVAAFVMMVLSKK